MGYITNDELLKRTFDQMGETRRRQDSIDAYKADQTSKQGFDPEPVIPLSPESRKETALRRMLYDLKGVNW